LINTSFAEKCRLALCRRKRSRMLIRENVRHHILGGITSHENGHLGWFLWRRKMALNL